MKFQAFYGIRLENFAFKFDLRHFLNAVKVLALPDFASKRIFGFFRTAKTQGAGAYTLFFSSNLHKNLQITRRTGLGWPVSL